MDLTETLLRKRVVYQGRYLRAEEQIVRQPDGQEAKREIITPPDAVGILPIDASGNVYLVRQYRPAIRQTTLEIPAGVIDPGETPLETARRECAEEIGYCPEQLDFLFKYYHSVGFSSGKIEVFLGQNLSALPEQSLDDGEFIEVFPLSFDDAYQKTLSGKIVDSKTLLALLWYKTHFLSK